MRVNYIYLLILILFSSCDYFRSPYYRFMLSNNYKYNTEIYCPIEAYRVLVAHATAKEIARAMELIFEALISLEIDHTVGDCVEDEEENMCIGLWVNIGIHPVPFYFKDSWENLVRDKRDSEHYVKYTVVNHIGKLP